MNNSVLAAILDYKRREVAEGRAVASRESLEAAARQVSPPRGFHRAILDHRRPGGLALIAEIKKASPSRGLIRQDFDPAALAAAYERGGAACLSVLTDGPSFQGSPGDLRAARDACALPCLRKDFLLDPWQVAQSRSLGADAILIILAAVDDLLAHDLAREAERLGMDVLFEAHDEAEVDRALALEARMIGINNRDLARFVTDLAVTERLAPRIPKSITVVTESGVATAKDIARLAAAGATAMLVGESLMRQRDVEAAARALLGPRASAKVT